MKRGNVVEEMRRMGLEEKQAQEVANWAIRRLQEVQEEHRATVAMTGDRRTADALVTILANFLKVEAMVERTEDGRFRLTVPNPQNTSAVRGVVEAMATGFTLADSRDPQDGGSAQPTNGAEPG